MLLAAEPQNICRKITSNQLRCRAPKHKTMANTYTQLYVHLVFAVKNRNSLIKKRGRMILKNILQELFKIISINYWQLALCPTISIFLLVIM